MPENDFDEPDLRQPGVDVDVAIELSQLGGTIRGIAHDMVNIEQELDRISHTLSESSYTLRRIQSEVFMFLLLIVIGIVVILGTLRHWF
jgi:hypothetical protein